jgi:PAS domain-containing protein
MNNHDAAPDANEECLKFALQAGQVGVWNWNIPEDRIEWSSRVYEIHGVPRGQFGGTLAAYRRLVHPDDLPRVSASIEDAVERRAPYTIEFRIVRPDHRRHGTQTH